MSQSSPGSEPTAASLVGSLSSFPLLDVLDLLARTGRTGELQVVGQGLDRRIWVDRGDLVDTGITGSPATGLFEMACIEDGWFYFTLADATPEITARATIPSVVEGLAGQVSEWRALVSAFPFDAVVRMSSTTPADEVQIRADQWQLLSLVGAGRAVRDVLSASPLHPLDTLRTLQELAFGHLVSADAAGAAPADAPSSASASVTGNETGAEPAGHVAQEPVPASRRGPASATPVVLPDDGDRDAAAPDDGDRDAAAPDDGDRDAAAPDEGDRDAAAPDDGDRGAAAPDDGDRGAAAPDDAGRATATHRLPRPVMPPPISGDPWSGALVAPPGTELRSEDDRG